MEEEFEFDNLFYSVILKPLTPEEQVFRNLEFEDYRTHLYNQLTKEDERTYFDLITLHEGCPLKPRQIAEELGIEVGQVYNLQKRIKHKLYPFIALLKGEDHDET